MLLFEAAKEYLGPSTNQSFRASAARSVFEEKCVKRITTELVDDLDGTISGQGDGGTASFGLDGKHYEIDLSNANAAQLREALAPFIEKARSASSSRAASSAPRASSLRKRSSSSSSAETQAIREWAQANGYPVGDRGRIAAEVREAYAAAN